MASDNHERSAAIDGFVELLRRVREDAGRPSFREMAKRSGAISHATLHDALQGVRMPSWETTVEFAKACGKDPQELRAPWEQAVAVVRSSAGCCDDPAPSDAPAASDEPVGADAPGTADAPAARDEAADQMLEPVAPASPRTPDGAMTAPSPRGPMLSRAIAAIAVAVAALLAVALLTQESADSEASTPTSSPNEAAAAHDSAPWAPSTRTSAQGCPENDRVAPGRRTLVSGDRSDFVRDVTIPDCSVQRRGRSVVKTWELKNTGTAGWTGRFLHRINAHEGDPGCRAPERVAIPDTEPGETVQVSVTVATPDHEAICFGRWMQTDAEGRFTFPQQRPYYYTFKVS